MSLQGRSIGIALSGGGYRATLFGLGSLWRLSDAHLLGKLDRITSVSGGSILAGWLAHRWRDLTWDDGRATNFREVIARPIGELCSTTIDVKAGLAGIFTPFRSAGQFLTSRYRKALFGDALLASIPAAEPGSPRFIFYATNMQTGRSFRFRQDMLADYVLGVSPTTSVSLATAVAASSAFPPVFSPILLSTDPDSWRDPIRPFDDLRKLRAKIHLADGGIYDNLGLESLVGKVDVILVSDAGAPFEIERSPAGGYLRQLGRVRDVLIDQTRALRKRWLVEALEAGRRQGAYWGIGTRIDEYGAVPVMISDNDVSGRLETIATRLAAFPRDDQGRLINWGYALADAALRTRAGLAMGHGTWPIPEFIPG